MIYRICHCVTTGSTVGGPLLARRADKRVHAHARTCAPSGGNCGRFFGPQVCFKKMRSVFARQIGLSAETSSAAHTCARVSTYTDVWAKNGLVRATAERKSERGVARKWFDETKRWSAQLQIRFSAKWQLCHGHGHISFWITIIKMAPATYVLLMNSHLSIFFFVL